jgi:hypothetical protein
LLNPGYDAARRKKSPVSRSRAGLSSRTACG